MKTVNGEQAFCPYFSPEFKVTPDYIIMETGECRELNDSVINYFIFVLSGDIRLDFDLCTNVCIRENHFFFLPKNHLFKWRASVKSKIILAGYNAVSFPCTGIHT